MSRYNPEVTSFSAYILPGVGLNSAQHCKLQQSANKSDRINDFFIIENILDFLILIQSIRHILQIYAFVLKKNNEKWCFICQQSCLIQPIDF
jgi:hypothetical protein